MSRGRAGATLCAGALTTLLAARWPLGVALAQIPTPAEEAPSAAPSESVEPPRPIVEPSRRPPMVFEPLKETLRVRPSTVREKAPEVWVAPLVEWRIEFGAGIYSSASVGAGSGGLVASMLTDVRWRFLAIGMLVDANGTIAGPQEQHVAPVAGFRFRPIEHLGFDLLGELGGHRISAIGEGSFASVVAPVTVWLPYAGFRLGIAWISSGPGAVTVGAWFTARADLSGTTVYPTVVGGISLDGAAPIPQVVATQVGGPEFAGTLRIGYIY